MKKISKAIISIGAIAAVTIAPVAIVVSNNQSKSKNDWLSGLSNTQMTNSYFKVQDLSDVRTISSSIEANSKVSSLSEKDFKKIGDYDNARLTPTILEKLGINYDLKKISNDIFIGITKRKHTANFNLTFYSYLTNETMRISITPRFLLQNSHILLDVNSIVSNLKENITYSSLTSKEFTSLKALKNCELTPRILKHLGIKYDIPKISKKAHIRITKFANANDFILNVFSYETGQIKYLRISPKFSRLRRKSSNNIPGIKPKIISMTDLKSVANEFKKETIHSSLSKADFSNSKALFNVTLTNSILKNLGINYDISNIPKDIEIKITKYANINASSFNLYIHSKITGKTKFITIAPEFKYLSHIKKTRSQEDLVSIEPDTHLVTDLSPIVSGFKRKIVFSSLTKAAFSEVKPLFNVELTPAILESLGIKYDISKLPKDIEVKITKYANINTAGFSLYVRSKNTGQTKFISIAPRFDRTIKQKIIKVKEVLSKMKSKVRSYSNLSSIASGLKKEMSSSSLSKEEFSSAKALFNVKLSSSIIESLGINYNISNLPKGIEVKITKYANIDSPNIGLYVYSKLTDQSKFISITPKFNVSKKANKADFENVIAKIKSKLSYSNLSRKEFADVDSFYNLKMTSALLKKIGIDFNAAKIPRDLYIGVSKNKRSLNLNIMIYSYSKDRAEYIAIKPTFAAPKIVEPTEIKGFISELKKALSVSTTTKEKFASSKTLINEKLNNSILKELGIDYDVAHIPDDLYIRITKYANARTKSFSLDIYSNTTHQTKYIFIVPKFV